MLWVPAWCDARRSIDCPNSAGGPQPPQLLSTEDDTILVAMDRRTWTPRSVVPYTVGAGHAHLHVLYAISRLLVSAGLHIYMYCMPSCSAHWFPPLALYAASSICQYGMPSCTARSTVCGTTVATIFDLIWCCCFDLNDQRVLTSYARCFLEHGHQCCKHEHEQCCKHEHEYECRTQCTYLPTTQDGSRKTATESLRWTCQSSHRSLPVETPLSNR